MGNNIAGNIQDTNKGPLKWTVKKEGNNGWSIRRNSKRQDDSATADLFEKGYADQDAAMQVLWDLKERNIVRIAATQRKLDNEQREQDALIKEIGIWTPPVPPDEGQ